MENVNIALNLLILPFVSIGPAAPDYFCKGGGRTTQTILSVPISTKYEGKSSTQINKVVVTRLKERRIWSQGRRAASCWFYPDQDIRSNQPQQKGESHICTSLFRHDLDIPTNKNKGKINMIC